MATVNDPIAAIDETYARILADFARSTQLIDIQKMKVS